MISDIAVVDGIFVWISRHIDESIVAQLISLIA
jgi:hypothetical protein